MDDNIAMIFLWIFVGAALGCTLTLCYKQDTKPVKYVVIEQNQLVKP